MSHSLDFLVCQKCRFGRCKTASTIICDIVDGRIYGSPPSTCVKLKQHSRAFNNKPGCLSKDVCRRCIINTNNNIMNKCRNWNNADEKRWKEGSVLCPTSVCNHNGQDFTAIDRYPPEWCLYNTEQIVNQKTIRKSFISFLLGK